MKLVLPSVLWVFAFLAAAQGIAAPRPNILFIYTDDHSHRTIGCYGESYPFVRTPNIDQLASAGVRFKYAYIGTWCMPSRASLLTGHYPHAIESMRMVGTYPGSEYDPEKCRFWPSVFRQHGYQTAQIGKWHTGTDTGMGRDWDFQIVWNRPRHTSNAGNYYKDQLIVFTSDQGFAFGQHGFRMKVAPYDANIRSPLIVSMPQRLPSGRVCETPVGGTDLVPTFFEFAGIELPWPMHGRSLAPLLRDPDERWKRPLLTTFTARQYGSDTNQIPTDPSELKLVAGVPWYVSLHDGRYKYIRTLVQGETEELYDLDADPEELDNLAADGAHQQRLEQLREQTIAELRRTDAGFADRMPAVAVPGRR